MDSREYLIELRTDTGMTRREFANILRFLIGHFRTGSLETAKCLIICCDLWLIRLKWKNLWSRKTSILTICCFQHTIILTERGILLYEIIFYDTADGKCPVQDF